MYHVVRGVTLCRDGLVITLNATVAKPYPNAISKALQVQCMACNQYIDLIILVAILKLR